MGLAIVSVVGCRGAGEREKPSPEGDARIADAKPNPGAPACVRQETCGQWVGCVLARPQPVPFVVRPGEAPITSGNWYRFDWQDRHDEVGQLGQLCVGDAGHCYEGLQHMIPCLPVFNLIEPDYRCEKVGSECRKIPN